MLTAHDNCSFIIKAFEVGFDIKALTRTFLITLSYRVSLSSSLHISCISICKLRICTKSMYFTDDEKALAKHNKALASIKILHQYWDMLTSLV